MKIKNKIIIFFIIFIILILIILFIFNNNNKNKIINEEYQPEEEISVVQERKTMISLYFKNKVTNNLEPEVRLIDVKLLMDDPYNTIINLLLEGPKKENLINIIPKNTKVNNIYADNDTLIIDFSQEFIDNNNEENDEKQIIDSLVKTFTELTEINSIKILINGEENKEFNDGKIKFNELFIREE